MNQSGIFTINSQPMVNGIPSEDLTYGWGPPGGYIYQKNYLEFLISQEHIEALTSLLDTLPTINYQALNA
jgi:methylenetetrahydrofolate reductase (NADPH)